MNIVIFALLGLFLLTNENETLKVDMKREKSTNGKPEIEKPVITKPDYAPEPSTEKGVKPCRP